MCKTNLVKHVNLIRDLYSTYVRKCVNAGTLEYIDVMFDIFLDELGKVTNSEYNKVLKYVNTSETINNSDIQTALFAAHTMYKIYQCELCEYFSKDSIYDFDGFFEYILSVIYPIFYAQEEEF